MQRTPDSTPAVQTGLSTEEWRQEHSLSCPSFEALPLLQPTESSQTLPSLPLHPKPKRNDAERCRSPVFSRSFAKKSQKVFSKVRPPAASASEFRSLALWGGFGCGWSCRPGALFAGFTVSSFRSLTTARGWLRLRLETWRRSACHGDCLHHILRLSRQ